MHDVHATSVLARERVSASTTSQSFFARWLARRDWDAHGYELVRGRITRRGTPCPACTGVARRLRRRMEAVAVRSGSVVLEPRQGLELPTGDTLLPDISVVSAARWADASPSAGDLLRVVPELVVEVLPESIVRRDREDIREIYERAGVREYWIVDTHTRTVTVCVGHPGAFELGWVLSGTDMLRTPLLPGLRLGLGLLF
ncbi:MAG TPA: Uma2 family endonuclease [Nannocystaceae bacterium]|nr:Uma2 family endonuclease [Nannocystaceae bacterium]